MRYCGHFLIKAEGGAKNYERNHPLPLAWRPFTAFFVQRKGYTMVTTGDIRTKRPNPRDTGVLFGYTPSTHGITTSHVLGQHKWRASWPSKFEIDYRFFVGILLVSQKLS